MPMAQGGTYWVCQGRRPAAWRHLRHQRRAAARRRPAHWFAYISVDDVDARVAKATAAGAELLRPLFDVPGVGRIAILKDPTGAAIGWITPTAR